MGRSLDVVGRSALACLAAWALLTLWALLLPPFQVVDEVQHAMRTTSVLADPWVTAGDSFVVDQRFTNPMSRAPGPALGKLFFKNYNSLQMSDVPPMKARRWGEDPVVDEVREKWAAASYPPLYHWLVFGIAQPATSLLHLTPYQSTYAYRLASIFWAGVSWSVVYGLLERRLGIAAAVRALGMLLGIPMLAYASSGVNPDALAIPLSAAGILAVWNLGETGAGVLPAAALLLAAALAKPTGLTLVIAVVAAVPVAWAVGAFGGRRAAVAVAVALSVLAIAYVTFYAWSPPHFLGTGPTHATLGQWASGLPARASDFWIMYWGWLGWLDYRLGWPWYRWLIPVAAVNAVIGALWVARRRSALFLPTVWIALAGLMCAGEFVYLHETGYNLQGRHLLVAGVGLAPLVTHESRWAWGGLLGYLCVLHLRLLWQTFLRYYAGDAGVLWATLPFN